MVKVQAYQEGSGIFIKRTPCLIFYSLQLDSTKQFVSHLGHNAVTECSQAVCPIGSPISHSTHGGFRLLTCSWCFTWPEENLST